MSGMVRLHPAWSALSFGIAVDDTSVYWTDNPGAAVMKAPK